MMLYCHSEVKERMIDWMIYTKIDELKNNGLKKTQVARRLNINRETVSTYWDMSPSEYAAKEETSKTRRKKADKYKEFVLECLTKYPTCLQHRFMTGLRNGHVWKH